MCSKAMKVEQLALEDRIEAFTHCIIVAIPTIPLTMFASRQRE